MKTTAPILSPHWRWELLFFMLSEPRPSSIGTPDQLSAVQESSASHVPLAAAISKLRTSGYAFAFASVLLAFVLRLLIDPWLGNQDPYITFIVAVAITGLYRGLRAACLAAVLGAATAYFCFVPPRYEWGFQGISDAVGFAVYVLAVVAAILLTHARIRASAEAEKSLKAQIGAERKLLDAESLFRHFMDHSSACAYLRDEQGRCVYANEAANREIGIAAVSSTDTTAAAPNADLPDQDREVMNSRRALEFIDRRPNAGGERYWLTSKFPFVDQSGRMFVGGISFDITDSIQAEEILRKTERLSAASQMASLLAHEINNPLSALTNLLFLLKAQPLASPAREFVCRADEELKRVNRIAAMTMSFYFENETPGPVRICEMIDQVVDVLKSMELFKDIDVRREYRCDAIIVTSAPRMRQLIANLLTNAMESGAKTLHIRVRRSFDCHGEGLAGVRITITDDGCGIGPELRGKIFEPFFSTKAERGTGLGLWASQAIILRNNGRIKVRSAINGLHKGTCVSFFWPTPPDRRVLTADSTGQIVRTQMQSHLPASSNQQTHL